MLTGVLVNSDNKVITKVNGNTVTVFSEDFKALPVDQNPVEGSNNLITSGGVKAYIDAGNAIDTYTKSTEKSLDGKSLTITNVVDGVEKPAVVFTPAGGDGKVKDVQVDGTSVLDEATGVASITIPAIPTNVSAFNNDVNYATEAEAETAKNEAIAAASVDATAKSDKAYNDAISKAAEIYAAKATTLAGYGITDAPTTAEMNSAIATEIGKMTHIEFKVVNTLAEITETNKIYLVKQPEGSKVKYKEYIKLTSGTIEEIGDTDIDLSEYAKKTEIPDISTKQDKLIAGTGISIAEDGKTISASGALSDYVKATTYNSTDKKLTITSVVDGAEQTPVEVAIGGGSGGGDGKVKDIKIDTTSILDESTGVATIAVEGTYDGTDSKIVTTEALGTVVNAKQDEITTENKLDYSLIGNTPTIPEVPTTVSSFTNDAGYLTEHQSLAGLATETYVGNAINTATTTLATKTELEGYVAKDGTKVLSDVNYSEADKAIVDSAITSYESAADIKTKLDNVSYYPSAVPAITLATSMETDTTDLPNVTQVRSFVNSSINSVSAYYITADALGNAFASKAALAAATTFYYDGAVRIPTKNDYALVLSDESKNYASTRYVYTGSQWSLQYVVNNAPFSEAQSAAINSGATSGIIANAAKLGQGTAGQFLKSTGTSVEWASHPVMKYNGSDAISSINFIVDANTRKLTITIE